MLPAYCTNVVAGRTLEEAKSAIAAEVTANRSALDALTQQVVSAGLATWAGGGTSCTVRTPESWKPRAAPAASSSSSGSSSGIQVRPGMVCLRWRRDGRISNKMAAASALPSVTVQATLPAAAGDERLRDPERYAAFASTRRNDAETDWHALAAAAGWRPAQAALFTRAVAVLAEVVVCCAVCVVCVV